ncbi:STAS domain-containing protein [Niallia sp. NCCP-28]|uniref:STAS domain-containing protein n=1 Tax=Niallia sp. NCCP-28 TaxID=2934712 RepID=UPI0020864D69|nr:STAS domain-containing protein [Niallia sp. NCCP-28]GKU83342.1 RsbT co-antagonist protein RsbRD [Niallia sp. NCCP-28]
MIDCRKDLYTYLKNHINNMTDDWLKTIENSPSTYYNSNISAAAFAKLKESHRILIENVLTVFIEDEDVYTQNLNDWAVVIAEKRSKELVPILESIQQLNQVKLILISYIRKFAENDPSKLTVPIVFNWIGLANFAFELFTNIFIEYYDKFKHQQLSVQQEIINDLSNPVIPISDGIGVMPLIGVFDMQRTRFIVETTLEQCSDKKINNLFIDLSGVPIIDMMAANQLYHVIYTLQLIGVKAHFSGIRPQVAQTIIQLGIDFSKVSTFNNLASALASLSLPSLK